MKNVGGARNRVKYQKNDCQGNWYYDNNLEQIKNVVYLAIT